MIILFIFTFKIINNNKFMVEINRNKIKISNNSKINNIQIKKVLIKKI